MKKIYRHLLSLISIFFVLSFFACNEEEERPEVINKLRAIGVKAEPGITSPSEDETKLVTLTIYTLLPEGGQIDSITEYKDQISSFALPAVGANIASDQITYEDVAKLRLASFQATIPVPKAEALDFEAFNNVIRYRFGVTVVSGDEKENIVNDFLVVPADDESLNLKAPTISISAPTDGESFVKGTEIDVKAEIDKGDENIKIGWYVSGGEIDNRRAKEALWKLPDEVGAHALIIGLYSSKTRTFSYQTLSVNVTE